VRSSCVDAYIVIAKVREVILFDPPIHHHHNDDHGNNNDPFAKIIFLFTFLWCL
jgi:hypothetical protein